MALHHVYSVCVCVLYMILMCHKYFSSVRFHSICAAVSHFCGEVQPLLVTSIYLLLIIYVFHSVLLIITDLAVHVLCVRQFRYVVALRERESVWTAFQQTLVNLCVTKIRNCRCVH